MSILKVLRMSTAIPPECLSKVMGCALRCKRCTHLRMSPNAILSRTLRPPSSFCSRKKLCASSTCTHSAANVGVINNTSAQSRRFGHAPTPTHHYHVQPVSWQAVQQQHDVLEGIANAGQSSDS